MNWTHEYMRRLTEACDRYERTAPTVRDHCDDLYIRMGETPEQVTLAELLGIAWLWESGDTWPNGNVAANHVYRLRDRLKMDTTGNAGF